MAALEQSDLLRGAFRVIAEAAASVGSTQIRNRATIGGNIANASPAADLAAPLIALNASAHILREGAVFDLPVSELITGAEKAVLRPLDILLGFTLPAFPKEAESHYYKLGSREQLSISRFGVAMVLRRTQGLVEQANIAIGAIGAKAVRMPDLERALIGRRVDTSSADALGDLLADYIRNTSRRQYKAWASFTEAIIFPDPVQRGRLHPLADHFRVRRRCAASARLRHCLPDAGGGYFPPRRGSCG